MKLNVTGCPAGEGFGAPASVAVVASCSTVIVTVGELESMWLVSPEYTAVRIWMPTPVPTVVPTLGLQAPPDDTCSVHSVLVTPL